VPTTLPVPTKNPGDVLTSTLWNTMVRDNLNKLLNLGHRTLTVAQFAALTGLEGTKGTVAGDEVYLEVDATNGILWHLVYESTETTYKWRFLGGPDLISEVMTLEPTASTTYAALTTGGPTIAVPRAGDYDVTISALAQCTSSGNGGSMSYDIGGTGAVDADSAFTANPGTVNSGNFLTTRHRRKAAIAAATTLTAKYKTPAGTCSFQNRYMAVRPVRLS
jgi:hypothetical protein